MLLPRIEFCRGSHLSQQRFPILFLPPEALLKQSVSPLTRHTKSSQVWQVPPSQSRHLMGSLKPLSPAHWWQREAAVTVECSMSPEYDFWALGTIRRKQNLDEVVMWEKLSHQGTPWDTGTPISSPVPPACLEVNSLHLPFYLIYWVPTSQGGRAKDNGFKHLKWWAKHIFPTIHWCTQVLC